MPGRDFIYTPTEHTFRRRLEESVDVHERRELLRMFRNYARNHREAGVEGVHVGEVLAQALDLLTTRRHSGNTIAFGAKCSTGTLTVRASQASFWSVLRHLLKSAMYALPEGGCVDIVAESLRPDRDEVRFSIVDNAPAIPPAALTRMLARTCETYREGEEPNDRRLLGFALVIAKTVVEADGGRVWVESEPGKGTTVYFTLPIHHGSREDSVHPS